MKILCLSKRTPRDLTCFDLTYMTFEDLKLSSDINVKYDVIVVDETEETVFISNLSHILLETPTIMAAADWTALEALLTEPLLVNYKTRSYIPRQRFTIDSGKLKLIANTTEALGLDIDLSIYHMEDMVTPIIVSSSHNQKLIESYGTRNDPSSRNIEFLKHRLTDLIFTHTVVADKAVNFDNTIPIITGKVHYPIVFEDELYAVDGAKALRHIPEGGMASVLVDFSPIGDVELVRIPDCEKIAHPDRTIFRMPEGKSFVGKSILFIIGGRFVMSNEFQRLDERTFVFDPYAIPLKNIVLSNMSILGEQLPNTIIFNDTDPEGTFVTEMQLDSNYENFIVLIDNPTVEFYMVKSEMTVRPGVLRFPPDVGGVLLKNMTREIVDYSRELEIESTIVYMTPSQRLNRLVNESESDMFNIAYVDAIDAISPHSINDKADGFTIIDIVAEEQ